MAETLSTLSVIAFVLAGVFLVVAAYFWFRFDVGRIIGDLSGKNTKRSIEEMRAYNESSGPKSYRPSATNASRGKLTGSIPQHNCANDVVPKAESSSLETKLLEENKADYGPTEDTVLLAEPEATDLLDDENETRLLEENKTPRVGGKQIKLLEEVMLIHTKEVI